MKEGEMLLRSAAKSADYVMGGNWRRDIKTPWRNLGYICLGLNGLKLVSNNYVIINKN
jgi:hypothetical protein